MHHLNATPSSTPRGKEESAVARTALVVDNDFFYREFVGELLERRGYAVLKAGDGKEGMARIEEGTPNIVFTDLVMPKIDGEHFIRLLRARFPDRPFAIVVVSGTLIEQMDLLKEKNADYYVAKGPIDSMADQLLELLDRIEASPVGPSVPELLEPGVLYPRKVTMELMDIAGYRQDLLDCLGVGVLLADRDARIVTANAASVRILGRPLEQLLTAPLTVIVEGRSDKARLVRELKRIVKEPSLDKCTFPAALRGKGAWVVVSLFRTQGRVEGWLVVMLEDVRWEERASRTSGS